VTKEKRVPEPELLDLNQFISIDQAKDAILRDRGFDECVEVKLRAAVEGSGEFNSDFAFVLSSISRTRALHEAIVREIHNDNPQVVFTLMRVFAETLALIRYTADHPAYFQTVVLDPREVKRPLLKVASTQKLVQHMDKHYSTHFHSVHAQLCDMSHFGALAVWNVHRIDPGMEAERRTNWSSQPIWKSDRECLIACAQLLELSGEMERALNALIDAYIGQKVVEDRTYEA
jgi:hypothetical protein